VRKSKNTGRGVRCFCGRSGCAGGKVVGDFRVDWLRGVGIGYVVGFEGVVGRARLSGDSLFGARWCYGGST
jgi:hypothetical protein